MMRRRSYSVRRYKIAVWICFVCALCAASVCSDARGYAGQGPRTKSSLGHGEKYNEGNRPTYVGSKSCALCHDAIYTAQKSTAMRNAGSVAAESEILRKHQLLKFHEGAYTLQIERQGKKAIYSVSNGHKSISVALLWAFGLGRAGQTYIYERNGTYYESRVSYFNRLQALDVTIGHPREPRDSMVSELGRPMAQDEVTKCFSCHTSEDMIAGSLVMADVHPGVTCENCHGPGSNHLDVVEKGERVGNGGWGIFNPARLAPADIDNFCGRCHRSTQDVLALNILDVRNVRFQPYRLENSRCYDPTDRRIDCLACHDPMKPLVTSPVWYDKKCLACHADRNTVRSSRQFAPACPVATSRCVTCHMPKTELPGAHFAFTDHYIRVVHPGKPYPG